MSKFRDLVIGIVASGAMLGGGQAMAADLYVPPVAMDYFSGAYVGVHGGWGWGEAKSQFGAEFANEFCGFDAGFGCAVDLDPNGGFVGGQIGWNFLLGNGMMLGIEGDYSFASLNDSGISYYDGGSAGTEINLEVDRMATIMARFGWTMDQLMPFVTAGYGWMHAKRTAFNPETIGFTSDKNWHGGFVVGGGAEYAIDQNWTIKGEYRYYNGSTENYGLAFGEGTEVDLSVHTIRFGVNYGF